MNRLKLIKKIENLKKIKSIIEIAKFDAIKKMTKSQKIREHHYEIANISQEIITFAQEQSNIFPQTNNDKENDQDLNALWIFITIPYQLIKVSYDKFEQIIQDEWKSNDKIIVVGNPAIKFANDNKYKILASFENLDNTAANIVSLVTRAANYNEYGQIKLVAKTPKIQNKPFIIYPINNSIIDKKKYKKMKYYYSLSDTIENISNSYINNIIVGIYKETYRLFYQEKIIKHESSIKSIDKKLEVWKNNLNKLNRQITTNEMIHIRQIVKSR